jgi:FtsP/CotA-like multicopper oxidase with cupredoxin domain
MTIEAFAESGKAPLMPGPLLRVPAGTTVHISIRNSLSKPLTLFIPAAVNGGPPGPANDSELVAPGTTGVFTIHATVPGNYVYHATVPTGQSRAFAIQGLLGGAFVVDSAGTTTTPNDRVLVIMEPPDSVWDAAADTARQPLAIVGGVGRFTFTINGRSWPNTERLHATVGDTLHWRVLNASGDRHPMHLHGSFFRVDAFSTAGGDAPLVPGQLVATQLLLRYSTMSMTWVADRPGNWLFHCHYALHLQPDGLEAVSNDPAMRDMTGLVVGTIVAPRPGVHAAGSPAMVARNLRLVAVEDSATTGERVRVPSMRFVLDDGGRRVDAARDISPELDLVRGEPVAVTIVNHLREPTSVHWHAIEVQDSYMDGVPGFSGEGQHLSPAIAPGDSFVARFTPPRAGTFMYHAHVDEMREQMAGLMGALIVREPGAEAPADDHVLFIQSSRLTDDVKFPLQINGTMTPDTIVLRAQHVARFRIMNLAALHHNTIAMAVVLTTGGKGSTPEQWRVLAKDGFSLPAGAQTPRLARQRIAMGETYDFAYAPSNPGTLRLEIAEPDPPRRTLAIIPIRVE